MTELPQQQAAGAPQAAKPQPNVYTLLLVVAVIVLGTTIGIAVWNLMTTYGLTFGQIFEPLG